MKSPNIIDRCSFPPAVLWLPVFLMLFTVTLATADDYRFMLVSTGADDVIGGFASQEAHLSTNAPAGIKPPAGLADPYYGIIKVGPGFNFILDEPAGAPARLYVDANHNGDFTDDPPTDWEPSPSLNTLNGKTYTNWEGSAVLLANYGSNVVRLGLSAYRLDKTDPRRAAYASTFFYSADYYRTGQVTLGSNTFTALLADPRTTGDFSAEAGTTNAAATLLIDINRDGKFSRHGEWFPSGKPFNIGGITYEIQQVSASGDFFQINTSALTVAETKPLPNLTAGHAALSFEATNTAGQLVKFPGDYHGKLVMLDFWATWCGPCVGEVPHIAAAYEQYHSKGFEILGVSLDRTNAAARVANFTKSHQMPWAQVYDAKYWQAEVAQLYAIDSIPRAFLVDGDTGLILAEGDSLRGDQLAATLGKLLDSKAKGGQTTSASLSP